MFKANYSKTNIPTFLFWALLGDMLVSLDVESLFTKVPLELTLALLEPQFPEPVLKLFHYVLKSTFF